MSPVEGKDKVLLKETHQEPGVAVSPTEIESGKESVKQKPGILDEKEIPQAEEKKRIESRKQSAPSPLVMSYQQKREVYQFYHQKK